MPLSKRIRMNRDGLLLALISLVVAGQVQAAAAGRVEFAVGGATLSGPTGQQRPLARGVEVNSGDVVRTSDGRVQVRMADGAYISLQPNTEFGIKDYKYEGKTDGTESALYSLLKGAMRTVTGLIGRINRNRYQVTTPTATVGIRGTGGLIQVLDDGSTLVQGTSGIWLLSNPAGTIDVPAGVSGVAPTDPSKPPRETGEAPAAGPAPLPPQKDYSQGDQINPDGTAVIGASTAVPTPPTVPPPPPVLQSGSGYMAVLAYTADTCGSCIDPFLQIPAGAASFAASGQLTQMSVSTSETYSLLSGGTHAEFGTDGIVAWGRWIGSVSVPETLAGTENYGPNGGFHYVVGFPTTTMPQSGSATYALIGATSPTAYDASGLPLSQPGTFSGSLSVSDWTSGLVTLDLNVNMPVAGLGYRINGNAIIPPNANSFFGSYTSAQGITDTTGTSCVNGCSAAVNGIFAGNNAERAGLTYHVIDSASINVIGAAAFQKQ